MNFTKNDIMRGVELVILLVTGLLLIFFVVRPLLRTARGEGRSMVTALQTTAVGGDPALAGALPGADGTAALPAPHSNMDQRIDIARIEGQVKASSVKKVAEFVEKHPEESANILRAWVQEG